MASVKDKPQAQSGSGDYRLPANGPHRYVKKQVDSEKEKGEVPPYVVGITKKVENDSTAGQASYKYDPQELKAKARAFLNSPNITSDQKNVLKDILGPEDNEKPT